MIKRTLSVILSLVMILTLLVFPAAADEEAWWEADVWSEEVLLSLGAQLPDYNPETGKYEISVPEQLLYLSGTWKTGDSNGDGVPDAPCDGFYVLTADLDMSALLGEIGRTISEKSGKTGEGYMPPIAALDKENEGEKCAFFGTFDGDFHVIRNLRVERMGGKQSGMFGNVGYDFGTGFVCNLGLLDAVVAGKAGCGLLAGGVYGDVWNCVFTGTILCEEKTAGGIAGKVKKNENGYLGSVTDCFVDCDILVKGMGGENGAAGGVSGANSNGGMVSNCYVLGSIVVEGTGADVTGGIVGNLKSGQKLDNNVMLLQKIITDGGTNIGLLCGSYSGESGSHIHNNYVWEGTVLEGNVASDHPVTATYSTVSTADAFTYGLYADGAGWDFENTWTWIGTEDAGYPVVKGFEDALGDYLPAIQRELVISGQILRGSEPVTSSAYEGEAALIEATVTRPVSGAKVIYGTSRNAEELTESLPMAVNGNTLSAAIENLAIGTYYYYIEAADGSRFPTSGLIRLDVVSPAAKYAPGYLTISPGETVDTVGINFTTEAGGLTAQLKYRLAGGSDWTVVEVTDIAPTLVNGEYAFTGYSVDLTGLQPGTDYEYVAVTNDGTKDYTCTPAAFTTLPGGDEFSFIVISDIQGTSEEAYQAYKFTTAGFLAELAPDFVINTGDLTEDNTLAQWQYMYEVIGDIQSSVITAYAPGNHESKRDPLYTVFKGRTNLPGGIDIEELAETTSAFVVGDVCFVTLNTEPYSGVEGADVAAETLAYYQAQLDWAKSVFEASGCKWRIICAHAGLVQDNAEAVALVKQMCQEMHVDLFFNGHIHNYFRATVKDGVKAEVGEGTTFITTSPMGVKFDEYGGEIDDVLQFQTGGSSDERQYFTHVSCTADTLTVTAYQRAEAGAPSKGNCKDYTVIDTFTLTKTAGSETPSQTPADPAAPAETPSAPVEPAAPADKAPGSIAPMLIVLAVVFAAAAVLIFLRVKKTKK